MTSAYVFSEDARLAAELVATAAGLADVVHLVCAGAPPSDPPAGLTSVIALEPVGSGSGPAGDIRPEACTAALANLIGERGADVILVGATVSGWEIAARMAAILGIGLISGATALRPAAAGGWQSERMMYAGAAVQTETWLGPAVVTMAAGQAPQPARPVSPGLEPASIERIPVPLDSRVRMVSRAAREIEDVDLAGAARIVCVGMGVAATEDLKLATDLADALGAELACTRPVAEDREWLPTERYIGISGVRVKPELYLGLGVSGQVQHTVAIRDAKVVVGVNTDPEATLFGICDYEVVGDLREIAPLLTEAIRAQQS